LNNYGEISTAISPYAIPSKWKVDRSFLYTRPFLTRDSRGKQSVTWVISDLKWHDKRVFYVPMVMVISHLEFEVERARISKVMVVGLNGAAKM
jgi:hypothetical protein